jgi:hypothetical protein
MNYQDWWLTGLTIGLAIKCYWGSKFHGEVLGALETMNNTDRNQTKCIKLLAFKAGLMDLDE